MENHRHDRLGELFERAVELSPDARGRFIEDCTEDSAVRAELRSLLAAHDRTPGLLDQLAGDIIPAALHAAIDQAGTSADADLGSTHRHASTPQRGKNPAPLLEPGTQLGTYTIHRRIAAGGIGVVYHAFDTALQRPVAIKTLAWSTPDARETLLREARAASALNQPHICTIYEVGEHDGIPFIAMEYIAGRPLREVIPQEGLPVELVIRYGVQVAEAVGFAHRHGIIHRDLKTANVMISPESEAKVLDFGLASRIPAADMETLTRSRVVGATSEPLAGTLAYLAPELLRGGIADARSDVWALGVLLYEMAAGRLPFQGATPFELTAAVLGESLPPLPPRISMLLRAVIGKCLIRDPAQRYQHAGEVRIALETLQLGPDPSLPGRDESEPIANHEPQRRLPTGGNVAELLAGATSGTRSRWLGMLAMALVLLIAAGYGARLFRPSQAPLVFHQLTFQQGFIESAAYAPGGDTVVFAASWDGGPSELYSLHADSLTGVRPLGISASRVLGVSRQGEIAFLQGLGDPNGTAATLAITPLGAGAPRQILEDILSADWSPAKGDLAVSHRMGRGFRLEYPVGTVIRETSGFFDSVRFSPDGDRIALVEHPVIGDSAGFVEVLDLSGHAQVLTRKWAGWVSVAWDPLGKEIWFTAGDTPNQTALYAVSLNGKQRMLASVPGTIVMQSVLPSGRALVIDAKARHGLMVSTPDHPNERDFAWLEWPDSPVFSPDGTSIAFTENSVATGGEFTVFSRKLTGEPAVRLANGWGGQISPDGKWVLAVRPTEHPHLWLHPLGPGESRQLTRPPVELEEGEWFPDSTRIAFIGRENGVRRTYLADLDGNVKPLTPPGVIGRLLTPDGKLLVTRYADRSVKLLPVGGGQPLPIRGVEVTDQLLRFSNDAKYLFVYTMESPVLLKIWRIDVASGSREFLRAVGPADPAGVYVTRRLVLGPDLRSYAYVYGRRLSSLYEVDVEDMR